MISENLKIQLGDWTNLYPYFESEKWSILKEKLKPDFQNITPDISNWFKAFKMCSPNDLKVVWLGLSPYYHIDTYTKEKVAEGLCFSTSTRNNVPKSLFLIYKAMETLYDYKEMDRSNNLEYLAKSGVLLLNAALTTKIGSSDSHLENWQEFTEEVLDQINTTKQNIIFIGFGGVANNILNRVDETKHIVYRREHPAKASYESRMWKHDNIFQKVNEDLKRLGKKEIIWDKCGK